MKSNFTPTRICLFIAIFSLSFNSAFSQSSKPGDASVNNLKASVQNNKLVINWNGVESNYSEIQASEDGKTFSTIGLVMGADPKQANNFSFKQDISKLKPGRTFYRVLTIDDKNMVYTSDVVNLSK